MVSAIPPYYLIFVCTYRKDINATLSCERKGAAMANVTMYVEKRADGRWAVSRPDSKRASALCEEKQDAVDWAHEIANGGPVHIQGANGKWTQEKRRSN